MAGRKTNKENDLKVYTDEQLSALEEFIEDNYGEIQHFFQEKTSENIRLNFYIIAPRRDRRFYTLITGGMGAHMMNVPEEFSSRRLERAELVINLPPYWKFEESGGEYFWPVHLLNLLAHLPIKENAWLGFGHTVDYGTGFNENTDLSSALIVRSTDGEDPRICRLSEDMSINFYQVIPLYPVELDFKIKRGAAALLDLFPDVQDYIAEPDRPSFVDENYSNIIDTVETHSSKVAEKGLDISEINGANHLAAFLMWAAGKKMLSEDTEEFFAEELFQMRKGQLDPRKFIINNLSGELTKDLFNEEGQEFAAEYYDFYGAAEPSYPGDVDRAALDYFGEEKYNCEEFQDEAYLFVPFGEEYCKALSRYINKSYRKFKKRKSISEQDLTNS